MAQGVKEVMSAREIDVLLAEIAMQWKRYDNPDGDFLPHLGWDSDGARYGVCPNFSTDPAASYQLRQKIRELGWNYSLTVNARGSCCVLKRGTHDKDWGYSEADADTEMMTFALACCAALGRPVELRA